ncbi:hypothetical protein FRB97_005355 [Tulasnella sp. 331]|nr:hypothetical protein FRB97_005355 [Tulasnella sp. 331]
MQLDLSHEAKLEAWLATELEPICDAEPSILAEYIIALLKTENTADSTEESFRVTLQAQLSDFIEGGLDPFIDKLLFACRSHSYISAQSSNPQAVSSDASIPGLGSAASGPPQVQPTASSSTPSSLPQRPTRPLKMSTQPPTGPRSRKRSRDPMDDQADEQDRGPPKGPRLSDETVRPAVRPLAGMAHGIGDGSGEFGAGASGSSGINSEPGPISMMNGNMNPMNPMGMGGMGGVPIMGMVGMQGIPGMPLPGGIPNMNGSGMNGSGGRPQQGPGGAKICYDYFNKGHCKRGETCKFSHGENPIAANALPFFMNSLLNGGPGFMMSPQNFNMGGMMMGGGPLQHHLGNGYRPPGHGMAFGGQRGRGGSGGEPIHVDMTPHQIPRPNMTEADGDATFATIMEMDQSRRETGRGSPIHMDDEPLPDTEGQPGGSSTAMMNFDGANRAPGMNGHAHPFNPQFNSQMNGGQGGGSGMDPRFQQQKRNGGGTNPMRHAGVTTVVVEKIPPTNLSEGAVTEYFKQFGAVTSVVLDRRTKQALVTFSEHKEASAAVRSPDAPWGNKYAKVFFHNPVFGKAVGAKVVAATPNEKPAAATIINGSTSMFNSPSKATPSVATIPSNAAREQLIAEQKRLLNEASSATAERKKEIIKALRELNVKLDSTLKAPAAAVVPPKSTQSVAPLDPAAEALRKLDEDLDMHVAEAGGSGEAAPPTNDNMEALKARLSALRAEATSLGLDPLNPESAPSSSYRGYAPRARGGRGRGRGRGGPSTYSIRGRGRGGPPPRGSMKLDLRPRKLTVKGVAGTGETKLEAAKEWFRSLSEVENFTISGSSENDLIVEFKTRFGAEQVLAKGSQIPGVGPAQMAWYIDGTSAGQAASGSSAPSPGVDTPENYEGSEVDDPDSVTAW